MLRNALNDLHAWKKSQNRKPLLLRGARRVGKTWLMTTFGESAYPVPPIYLNFDMNSKNRRFIVDKDGGVRDPSGILHELHKEFGTFAPESRLIIFDELQRIPDGLSRLKYFMEFAPEYHIIAGGSLLGMSIGPDIGASGFPVGIDEMDVHPLTFYEFLLANGKAHLAEILENRDWEALCNRHEEFVCDFCAYCMIGGMPNAVLTYIDTGDLDEVRKTQEAILRQYAGDFAKHAGEHSLDAQVVLEEIPRQLGLENEKFLFGLVRKGARYSHYWQALRWLQDAGMISVLHRTKSAGHEALRDVVREDVRLYMLDVGLAAAMLQYDPTSDLDDILSGRMNMAGYGWIAEQFVMQEFVAAGMGNRLAYFHERMPDGFQCEIDFLLRAKNVMVPVEVKSTADFRSESLNFFRERHHPKYAVRLSMRRAGIEDGLHSLPLFAASHIEDFLKAQQVEFEVTGPMS